MERLENSIETASERLALELYEELCRKGFHPPVAGYLSKVKP